MTSNAADRPAALAGLGFLALALIGTALTPSSPDFVDAPGAIAAYFKDGSDDILVSHTAYLLSAPLFLWFLSGLRAVLARAEGEDGRLAGLAWGAGIAGITFMIASAALGIVGALRVEEQGAIDPLVATALYDINMITFGLAAPTAMAGVVLAAAAVALRSGVLPRWLAGLSLPLGVALLVPPISYVAIIVFIFWTGIVGAVLVASARPERIRTGSVATAR